MHYQINFCLYDINFCLYGINGGYLGGGPNGENPMEKAVHLHAIRQMLRTVASRA